MSKPFSADEVFEMAEQIERNGAKFYRAAAEKFPTVRELLAALAEWEDRHERAFASMRAELAGTGDNQPVFDPDGQAMMYLRVMADGHIFNVKADPAEQLAGKDTPEEVLKMAIDVERDSVAFYVGLTEAVSDKAGKEKVTDIVREEISHVAILQHKLETL